MTRNNKESNLMFFKRCFAIYLLGATVPKIGFHIMKF